MTLACAVLVGVLVMCVAVDVRVANDLFATGLRSLGGRAGVCGCVGVSFRY